MLFRCGYPLQTPKVLRPLAETGNVPHKHGTIRGKTVIVFLYLVALTTTHSVNNSHDEFYTG